MQNTGGFFLKLEILTAKDANGEHQRPSPPQPASLKPLNRLLTEAAGPVRVALASQRRIPVALRGLNGPAWYVVRSDPKHRGEN